MKVLNNSVGRGSPGLKNATLFLVKPLPDQKSKAGDYGLLERAVSKQMKKATKKKKNPQATFHSQREMVDTR